MFVRNRKNVEEITFKADLTKLGLFINSENKIRQKTNPDEAFQYKVFKNPRWNERRREAMDQCIRRIVLERLQKDCGLKIIHCVQGTSHAHVPILVSNDLESNRDKCLVLFPGDNADLGIWSMRAIGEWGIEKGSTIRIVKKAQKLGYSIVIANTGALRYDLELGTTVTPITWAARRKPWRLGGMARDWDPTWNAVPGNETMGEHLQWVFENIVAKRVPKKAKIMVTAADLAAFNVVEYFDQKGNFNKFSSQLHALVLTNPSHYHTTLKIPRFQNFWFKYTRAYLTTYLQDPATIPPSEAEGASSDTPVPAPPSLGDQISDGRFGCSSFNSLQIFPEMVLPAVADLVMDYFELSVLDREGCNPTVHIDIDESVLLANSKEGNEGKNGIGGEYDSKEFPSWDEPGGNIPNVVEVEGRVGQNGIEIKNLEPIIEELGDDE